MIHFGASFVHVGALEVRLYVFENVAFLWCLLQSYACACLIVIVREFALELRLYMLELWSYFCKRLNGVVLLGYMLQDYACACLKAHARLRLLCLRLR